MRLQETGREKILFRLGHWAHNALGLGLVIWCKFFSLSFCSGESEWTLVAHRYIHWGNWRSSRARKALEGESEPIEEDHHQPCSPAGKL